ncbi:MAG: ABC transporter permease [Ignavibacteriae bacterium]|nr:MAG: ABC transporter permease [Ignavibacteriota bacterium]
MFTIIQNTFREAIAKKIFVGYYIIYTIIILVFLLAVNLDAVEGVISLTEVKESVMSLQALMMTVSYLLVLIFCIISSASFVPSMVDKGTIDLLISKPLSRFTILISKYLGAVIFVGISLLYFIGSIWLILSLKSGYWNFSFLFTILSLTFAFAVMYSIVVLIGLLTNSSIIAILVNLFLIFVLLPILGNRETIVFSFVTNEIVRFIFDFFYYIFPKPGEINDITIRLITHENVSSWQPVLTSFLFGAAVMAYSVYYFSRKDY